MMTHICTTEAEKEDCWIRVSAKLDRHNETLMSNKQTRTHSFPKTCIEVSLIREIIRPV